MPHRWPHGQHRSVKSYRGRYDRVSEGEILAGHFLATRDRAAGVGGPLMVLHDTTEFSCRRRRPERVGQTCRVDSGRDEQGRYRQHTVCGLLMPASLAVTAEGLPLGLAAVKFWTRKKFKGAAALKRKVNPTRVPIEREESVRWLDNMRQSTLLFGEPERCIHIGDRERHLRAVLPSAGARDALPGQESRRSARGRRDAHGRRPHGRGARPGAAPRRGLD